MIYCICLNIDAETLKRGSSTHKSWSDFKKSTGYSTVCGMCHKIGKELFNETKEEYDGRR